MNSYEESLNTNRILSWIHSLRYKETIKFLEMFEWKRPIRILEIGCANAKLFEVLNERFNIEYVGIDPYPDFAREAYERYKHRPNFSVIQQDASLMPSYEGLLPNVDIVICLETLEHMPLVHAQRILTRVKELSPAFFLCSFPVEIGLSVLLKNVASFLFGYHRHKNLYNWKETLFASIYRLDKLPPHTHEHKGFDWRVMCDEISERMQMLKILKFPFNVPSFMANSIFTISCPKQ